MKALTNRRRFLKQLGISTGAAPFLTGLPIFGADAGAKKKRLIIMFSPNGTIPGEFWPDGEGPDFQFKKILQALQPFKERTLLLRGISNRIGGDGDRHMRGMSCVLTGTELFPGNIQGGSDTPAGWASGISIDQELKNHLQSEDATRTRFGSLEFGVAVPNRADPWTRMSYAGPNQPVAPIDNPKTMMEKLYGKRADKESLASIVDDVRDDLTKVSSKLGNADRQLLDKHLQLVRDLERELSQQDDDATLAHPVPDIDPKIELVNDNTPRISRMQIDLLVNALANDMTRVATLQYMRSVGQARMSWLGVEEGHHGLSHESDKNQDAFNKLIKINQWFAGELAYMARRLADTPEPGGDGSMLDHTMILWINELGKGNSHTLDDIPFVLIGGEKASGFNMGRYVKLPPKTPHNQLLLAIANAMDHPIENFGTEMFCEGGALNINNLPQIEKPKTKPPSGKPGGAHPG